MDITTDRLLQAYAHGIFPMAPDRESETLEWYDPPLRGILPLDGIHLARSLLKLLRRNRFQVTVNRAFAAVIAGCATPRRDGDETWISPRIVALYSELHARGHAHSVEVWAKDENDTNLVGGTYGVALGRAFFGESMFSRVPNGSKIALAHLLARLRRHGFTLCDTQYLTDHLATFGAIEIPRLRYKQLLSEALSETAQFTSVSSGIASSGEADVDGGAVAALLAGAAGA